MTSARIFDDSLVITFAGCEKLLGVVRDLRVPLGAIQGAVAVADGYSATQGLRAPGMSVPGVRKLGTWRGRAGRQLVSARREQPAVLVRVSGQRYVTLLIAADDAEALASRLDPARR